MNDYEKIGLVNNILHMTRNAENKEAFFEDLKIIKKSEISKITVPDGSLRAPLDYTLNMLYMIYIFINNYNIFSVKICDGKIIIYGFLSFERLSDFRVYQINKEKSKKDKLLVSFDLSLSEGDCRI